MKYYNWSFYVFGTNKDFHWWRKNRDYQYCKVVYQDGAIVNNKIWSHIYLGVVQFCEPMSFADVKAISNKNIKWHFYQSDRRMFYRARSLTRGKIYVSTVYEAGVLIIKRFPKIKYWTSNILSGLFGN